MLVTVCRASVVCGSLQDSTGAFWGQNLTVTLGVTTKVQQETGLTLNTKILGRVSQNILEVIDHQTWDYPCSWKLEHHGLSRRMLNHIAARWDEQILPQTPTGSTTYTAIAPTNALRVILNGGRTTMSLSIGMTLEAIKAILNGTHAYQLDSMPTEIATIFSPKRHPLELGCRGGALLIVHANLSDEFQTSPFQNSPNISESKITFLQSAISRFLTKANCEDDLFANPLVHLRNYGLELGGDLTVASIEVQTDQGLSLLHSSNGQSSVEFRIGFNATHDLCLADRSIHENSDFYGPCSFFPAHGHRWGLSVRFPLIPGQAASKQIGLVRQEVSNLWSELHGSHLNQLTKVVSYAPATSEILVVYIRRRLESIGLFPEKIEIMETPRNSFVWNKAQDD
jgi:hypothetical protein